MLVCHCNVVNDRTIRAAVEDGACDLEGVVARCGAGGRCGGCVPSIEALLAEAGMALTDAAGLADLQRERRCSRELAGDTSRHTVSPTEWFVPAT